MLLSPRLRRPVFIYSGNHVGGGEYLCLRRAECAVRLGLKPVIITSPGPMDEQYRRVARLLHVDAEIFNRPAFTPDMAEAIAEDLAALLGPEPSHIEVTGLPDSYFASLLARRLPYSDYSLLIIRPGTVLSRGWPTWSDLWPDPRRLLHALRGRKENGVLRGLAAHGRVLTVNRACSDDAARLAGMASLQAGIEPAIVPHPGAVGHALRVESAPYLLTVARIDGMMKAYVRGLVAAFAGLVQTYPALRLKVVGDCTHRAATEAYAVSLGVDKSIDFLGTLPPSALPELYAGATAFVGMGTSACEAAMYGTPSVLALVYRETCETPGYFGEPGVEGYGEVIPGQKQLPVAELLRPLLEDADFAKRVGERCRARAFADHHPDAATERMRLLLSRAPVVPAPHPYPLPKLRQLLRNVLRGYGSRRPLAREA
jgi:glycosyltransferase involved in cell wall biosynthesis